MSDTITTFGFETGIVSENIRKFRGEQNQEYRIGVLYDDPQHIFIGTKVHWHGKYYFACTGKTCCQKLGLSKIRIGVPIIQYDIYKQELKGYTILIWLFAKTTYAALNDCHKNFPITDHDLRVRCSREEYQTFDFSPCRTSLWKDFKETDKANILAHLPPAREAIKKLWARKLTEAQIVEELGGVTPPDLFPDITLPTDEISIPEPAPVFTPLPSRRIQLL